MSVKDLLATRTVVIRFPGGESQYWLTDQSFRPGETLFFLNREWLISEVLGPAKTASYTRVTVRPPDNAAGWDSSRRSRSELS